MSIDVFPSTVLNSTLWNGQTYEEGTFTVTGTGFTTAVTGTARYVRVGKHVTLMLPTLTGTSNAVNFGLTGIPGALAPVQNINTPVLMADNGVSAHGQVNYNTGVGTWGVNLTSLGAWTASGTKTLNFCVVTYLIA